MLLRERAPSRRSRHAVVVVGHTMMPGGNQLDGLEAMVQGRGKSVTASPITTTAWVPHFYVHDDRYGPYLRLPIRSEHEIPRRGSDPNDPSAEYDALWGLTIERDVESALIVLPPGVVLCPLDAMIFARRFLQSGMLDGWNVLLEHTDDVDDIHFDILRQAASSGDLVLHPRLELGNAFRVRTFRQLVKEAPDEAGLLMRLMLPKFVYVVGISICSEVKRAGPAGAERIGYLLIDATATAYSSEDVILFARLGEVAITSPTAPSPVCDRIPFVPGLLAPRGSCEEV